MTTKTIELTIEERDNLCIVLEHCMDLNSNANMEYETVTHTYVWSTPEAEQEHNEMKALHLKLKPKTVQKSGYVLKERLPGEVWNSPPPEEIDNFQLITWEEKE